MDDSNKITKKFSDYKDKQSRNQEKEGEFKQFSDDIEILRKLDNGDYEKIDEPIEITKIIDIIQDEEELDKIEEATKGGFQLTTDLSVKEVKRGQIIWLTALLKRPHQSTPYNQTTMGVIKARVVDYYYGLNKLKYVQ